MAATNSSPIGAGTSVTTINTADLAPTMPRPPQAEGQEFAPGGLPMSETEKFKQALQGGHDAENSPDPSDDTTGIGVDGEAAVWEARYSKRNFIGRIVVRTLLTLAAGALAFYTWGDGHEDLSVFAWIAFGVVAVLWVGLIWRMIQAHYSHFYRLTNRRLFVSTGIFRRRRDMMELLTVKDVFTRQQSLLERWMSLGTVVVVPSQKDQPTFYLAGVDDPKEVMDLIWHHARAERDHRSVKVDSI